MPATVTIQDAATVDETGRPRRAARARRSAMPSTSTRGVSLVVAVVQFAMVGVVAVSVLALIAGSRIRTSGTEQAIRDARDWAELLADDVVTPRVTTALLNGDPTAIAEMDEVVDNMVLKGPVIRMKLWLPNGRIVYSDEHRLIGQTFVLDEDVKLAFATGEPYADITTLDEMENEFDGGPGKRLEVYMPIRLATGETLIYEHYQHTSAVSDSAERVASTFSPVVLRSLIALELLQLPLAWWLAQRVRAAQRQKVVLLQGALDASDNERRRIAQDLHDGVVQDLAGVSYSIDAVRHDPTVTTSPEVSATLERVVGEAQRSIRELRTLLVDIYPPSLEEGDLAGALSDVLVAFESRGVHTAFRDEGSGVMSSVAHGLVYRTAREALRNVEQHANASNVSVVLRDVGDDRVSLEIVDDGVGFDAGTLHARQADGHLGVRLLGDVARAAGGELHIESAPGEGTLVRLVVPR